MRIKKTALLIAILNFMIAVVMYSQNAGLETYSKNIGSVLLDLTEDDLVATNMHAFEQRALQKVKDFNNYIEIISNQNYDQSLRDHAITLALQLFANENSLINNKIIFKNEKNDSIDKWLRNFKQEPIDSLKVTITNMEIKQKYTIRADGSYHSIVAYHVNYFSHNKQKSGIIDQTQVEVEIILKKIDEQIGNNYTKVWKVFLGDIK